MVNKENEAYKQLVWRICDSIVKAIEFGNVIIARGRPITGVKLVVLKEFDDKVVNRNMAVFYSSLMSSDILSYAVELMNEGGLVSDETLNARCF